MQLSEPIRWILVERRYADIESNSAGDGRINPDSIVLTFQPLYPKDLTWEVVVSPDKHYVELVEFSPSGPASPGEVITARVRVGNAKRDQVYVLMAKPCQPEVKILGQEKAIVSGDSSAVFTFTSLTSGRGGIAVGVQVVANE